MRLFNPRKLRYAKAIDGLGRLIFRVGGRKTPGTVIPLTQLSPRRVLILESHLIGDIVMAIPALRALRRRYPSSKIHLVAGPWAKELLNDQGLVDDFVEVRFPWSTYDYSPSNLGKLFRALRILRKHQWDLGIDLRGDIRNIAFLYLTRPARRVSYDFTGGEYLLTDIIPDPGPDGHIVDYNAHLVAHLGCAVASREPSLPVLDLMMLEAQDVLRSKEIGGGEVIIGIHPGASKPLRHWRADRFARLADMLLEDPKNRVLLFQGPADRQSVMHITQLMTHTAVVIDQPLRRLPALFKCCSVLIGLDSGAVHLAAAVGIPTVVLFGPAEPGRVKPMSPGTTIVIKDGYSCRPCDQVHCIQPLDNCMDALQVGSVYQHVVRILKTRPDFAPEARGGSSIGLSGGGI